MKRTNDDNVLILCSQLLQDSPMGFAGHRLPFNFPFGGLGTNLPKAEILVAPLVPIRVNTELFDKPSPTGLKVGAQYEKTWVIAQNCWAPRHHQGLSGSEALCF